MGSLYLQVFKQTEHYQCLHISDYINIDKFKFHLTENNVHYHLFIKFARVTTLVIQFHLFVESANV